MQKLMLMCLGIVMALAACQKTESVQETVTQEVEEKTATGGLRSGMFYLDIPSQYEADPNDPSTIFTETYTRVYQGNTYSVSIEIEVTNGAIVSASCSDSWANTVNIPANCLSVEQGLIDELETIMDAAADEGFRAPKWWTKIKKFFKKVFVGCTHTWHTTNPNTGQCTAHTQWQHWTGVNGLINTHTGGEACQHWPIGNDCD